MNKKNLRRLARNAAAKLLALDSGLYKVQDDDTARKIIDARKHQLKQNIGGCWAVMECLPDGGVSVRLWPTLDEAINAHDPRRETVLPTEYRDGKVHVIAGELRIPIEGGIDDLADVEQSADSEMVAQVIALFQDWCRERGEAIPEGIQGYIYHDILNLRSAGQLIARYGVDESGELTMLYPEGR